jgi:ribokinase
MRSPITIVGSLNMDFVVQVEKLPQPGETVMGFGFSTLPGGKGANQACAVGKLGGRARMVGRVGDDALGAQLRESLRAAGVDTAAVRATEGTPSGVALIFVQQGGQNQIVVASGANTRLTPEDVRRELQVASEGLLLLQLESPMETVEEAAALGRRHGMRVVLDPAPARPLPDGLLRSVDCLTPNESEALLLLDRTEGAVSLAEAPEIASALLHRGPRSVILKLGERGAFLHNGERGRHFPGLKVEAVDATAAGDTFNGALAVALAEGRDMAGAISFANTAAALSVTRLGAQVSIPTRDQVEAVYGEMRTEPNP